MNDTKTPSRRRNPQASVGFVNFPVDRIHNSGEGGVFVRLVVIDTKGDNEYMDRWIPCCGGYNQFTLDECFLGDDLFDRSYPDTEAEEAWTNRDRLFLECQQRYLPSVEDESENDGWRRYMSRHFLCVMTIGATGWSSGEWVCTRDDLTPEGKALVASLEVLYSGCEVRLLTFLDT